jgi:hypothetical protein
MLPLGIEKDLACEVARLIHADKKLDAAKQILEISKVDIRLMDDNPEKYLPVLQNYLHILLENNAMEEAAAILWTPTLFSPGPQSTKDLWKLFDESRQGLIMGAGSMSKSYSMGVRLFLEYCRDPEFTAVRVIGPSEDHLEANLFSHLVRLHQMATLPMPGQVGELFIGSSRRNQVGAIKGLVIPVGKAKKAGRIQGTKRVPRPSAHYKFGALSRLFLFLDEIENIPEGVWGDIDNVLSQVEEAGEVSGFKIFGAYNPRNRNDEVGTRAEPPFGWESFNPDEHFRWKSLRGWDVLRLDGEQSENVLLGKIVYPGLQTRAGLDAIALNAGGRNSPGYYTMGRGAYPPQGIELSIIPPGLVSKMRGEFIWLDPPRPCGSCDLALEGGAAAIYTLGEFGKATGMKLPPSLEFPNGRTIMFKDAGGQSVTRMGIQAKQQFTIPKGDTLKMKTAVLDVNKRAGVRPEFFSCDRTGAGSGVADLMKYEWSVAIHDVNYSNSPSETKLMFEDTKICKEEYDRINSELWYALRAFGEFGYLLIHPSVSMEKLNVQLTQRKSKDVGNKKKVEAKRDYISRGHESPDEADSLTLLVHGVRKGSGMVPSMKGHDIDPMAEDDAGWRDEMSMTGGTRIDVSNRSDYLDERGLEM